MNKHSLSRGQTVYATSTLSLILFLTLLVTASARAQTPDGRGQEYRWSLAVAGGVSTGGSWSSDIRSGMVAADLDGNICGDGGEIICFGPPLPMTNTSWFAYSFAAAYELQPKLQLRAQIGGNALGDAEGYYDGGTGGTFSSDAELFLELREFTTAALAAWTPVPALRLAAGPMLSFVTVDAGTGAFPRQDQQSSTTAKLGLVGESGLSIPSASRIFIDLAVQYRLLGSVTVGPIDAKNEQGATLTRLQTSMSLNKLIFTIGLGVRF